MAKRTVNNIKLGAFVLGGLLFLVLLLYMIGRNGHLFGSTYTLKTRFENVQGLVAGNNVRFAGINAGTVKKISIISDTVIEVTMVMDKKMRTVIRKNAIASIGTDGLVGNKVLNIVPAKQPAPLAEPGDLLASKKLPGTDEMLGTLNNTNNDIAAIAASMKQTMARINNSNALWSLLNDNSIPAGIRNSAANIQLATARAAEMVNRLNTIIGDVQGGKGSVGELLTDTSLARNLDAAVVQIKNLGTRLELLSEQAEQAVAGIRNDIDHGAGPVHALLKDSAITAQLSASLENIRKGTDAFNQDMEALKHSIFFRGYFKKLEKEKKKAAAGKQQ